MALLVVSGIAAGVLAPGASAGSARATVTTARITVTASEFKFTLSKASVPVGATVIFTVVNKGKISHDFKIAGKKTPLLSPGHKATITVTFKTKGRFAYLCTLTGHAGAGMRGKFAVGVAPVGPVPPATTTAATTTAPPPAPPPAGPVGTASTTVTVNMLDFSFQLSQSSIPSGKVTFVISNKGNEVHNFAILGNKAGAQIAPGTSETWTVSLPAGTYYYQCDVPFHVDKGMAGQFTVTP